LTDPSTTLGPAIWAIVPAAGSGSRMQSAVPKQYLLLNDRPVIQYSLERLCAHVRVRGVFVGISVGDSHWNGLARMLGHLSALLGTFSGGSTRALTVLNGLRTLEGRAQPQDWVMVHDAARPCLRLQDIDLLIGAAMNHADGALLALPVSDTVKRADDTGRVAETISRTNLWRALTPQMFRIDRLRQALEAALARGVEPTDEAAAIEAAGGRPLIVPGHPDNIKITVPEDLPLAELFLARQKRA